MQGCLREENEFSAISQVKDYFRITLQFLSVEDLCLKKYYILRQFNSFNISSLHLGKIFKGRENYYLSINRK